MVELINTEIKHLQGSSVDASVFVEVALVVIVREIIMLPVEEVRPTWIELTMWSGAAALLGLTYFLLRVGRRWQPTGGRGKQDRASDPPTLDPATDD